jgi:hypothetical protein
MGDVKLDDEQTAQLDKAREEKRQADEARQEERRNAEWSTEGYTPNPDGPNTYRPETEIVMGKLTPEEKKAIGSYVTGPALAILDGAKGAKEGFPDPVKTVGKGLLGAVRGYASGKGAGEMLLNELDPSVPRLQKRQ